MVLSAMNCCRLKHFEYRIPIVAIPRFLQQAGKLGVGIAIMRIPDF